MATLKHIPHSYLQWDEIYNNNLDELDARSTANGGGIIPTVVSDSIIWMNGVTSHDCKVEYYQLSGKKRVHIMASSVIIKAPKDGQSNNGLTVGRLPQSLAPAINTFVPMSDAWTFEVLADGTLKVWTNVSGRDKVDIPAGSTTLNFDYETN
ncbi:hypothetical protein [uncultured Limosilactobacillus sp.]|uniref:hypothetical protein n=1 Tax=uncultured Limosilactobacillus sp. TaxID=2837629 RepID=UPI0025EA3C85|nr:hypothetical protein [uncultured Limosilactobacillus sp.]